MLPFRAKYLTHKKPFRVVNQLIVCCISLFPLYYIIDSPFPTVITLSKPILYPTLSLSLLYLEIRNPSAPIPFSS